MLPAAWSAGTHDLEKGRLYVGVDGLLVRTVTEAEKRKRRRAHSTRRRVRGRRGVKNLRAPPSPRPGADLSFKGVKFAVFYDQPKDRRHALASAGGGDGLGRLLRSHAAQVGIGRARQGLGLTDGAAWIARQLEVNLPMLTARRRGWDIGSGPTESMGKSLARRLRGPGMKWDLDHAADLMNLKAMYESGQSEAYWSPYAAGACLN